MKRSNETGRGLVRWSRWKRQTKLAQGLVRWSRWKGRTKLAQNMARWEEWRAKPSWRGACSVGADERVKPSWRRAWSVGPMEGSNESCRTHRPLDRWTGQTKLARVWSVGSMERSNQAGGGHRPLEPMEGSDGPLPGFGRWSGALTLSGSREFKGRPRDNKTIGSVQLKLPFPRSIDKVSTGARGAHQATAPSTQLVGCDGDWPACRSGRALAG
jgi:hypothetical protein